MNQRAVYIGTLLAIWGHFITDGMRLVWFLRSKEYAEKFSGCPVIYFPEHKTELQKNHKRLLEILGIDFSKLTPITQLTKYKEIILPDECFFPVKNEQFPVPIRFFTPEYVEMADALRNFAAEHATPMKSDKVYFSYSRYKNGRSIGEDKLEKYFASKGYEIVYPETLTFDEQLNVLANTNSFASTVGSISHNMIFLKDGAEVILIPRICLINGYQTTLDQVHRLRIYYVDSSFSIFWGKYSREPCLYFVSSKLREFFRDEDTSCIVDASDFRRYKRLSYSADNPDSYKYYSNAAAEYFGKLFASSWRAKYIRIRASLKASLKKVSIIRRTVQTLMRILKVKP